VTLAGSIAGALQESPALHFTPDEIGRIGSAYLAGVVIGAVLFGYLTDRFGRRRLFFVTYRPLFDRDRGNCLFVGFRKLRALPGSDRRWHRPSALVFSACAGSFRRAHGG